MDKYYYLLSEIPYLIFGKESNITQRLFLAEAEKWLSEKDYIELVQLNINEFKEEQINNSLLDLYRSFEFQLRSELAKYRRDKKEGREYKSHMFSPSIFKDGDPLDIEKKLLKLRWDFIEENGVGHNFDLHAVMTYYLKLQINRTLYFWEKEKGRENFNSLVNINENEDQSEVA